MAQHTKKDPKHEVEGKIGWTMQDCFYIKGGLFKLTYEVNNKFFKYGFIHLQFLRGFVVNLYNYKKNQTVSFIFFLV